MLGPGFSAVADVARASQDAEFPPPDPVQLQVHGPEPATAEAVPALHKSVVGALAKPAPLAPPQAPFTDCEPLPAVPAAVTVK